jgi:hypothetical protein
LAPERSLREESTAPEPPAYSHQARDVTMESQRDPLHFSRTLISMNALANPNKTLLNRRQRSPWNKSFVLKEATEFEVRVEGAQGQTITPI